MRWEVRSDEMRSDAGGRLDLCAGKLFDLRRRQAWRFVVCGAWCRMRCGHPRVSLGVAGLEDGMGEAGFCGLLCFRLWLSTDAGVIWRCGLLVRNLGRSDVLFNVLDGGMNKAEQRPAPLSFRFGSFFFRSVPLLYFY